MLKLQTDMKLFFDARYIRTDFHDGISRYSAELGSAIAKLTPVTFLICDKAQLKILPKNAHYILIHPPTSAQEPFTSLILNRYHPEVVFSPMQTMGSLGRNFRLILTLHDMIFYRHRTPPHQLNAFIRAGWRLYHTSYIPQRMTLNSADAVATVSDTSKRDILKAKLTRQPVVVIHNAPQNLQKLTPNPVRYNKEGPRNLIYMGSFMPYKNVETLIASMQWLPNYTLHLLSRISLKRKSELLVRAPKNAHIIFHGGVTDEQYATLLSNNAILVTASRDEGYGLPVAEALSLGVPAVISDLPIFHEVAGEGALYAAPNNPQDFAEKVMRLDDAKLRKTVIKKGQEHVAQFSWSKSARTLLELAESLV